MKTNIKTARLEIRLAPEDKAKLQILAEKEGCTVTAMLQEYIEGLVQGVQRPSDSDRGVI